MKNSLLIVDDDSFNLTQLSNILKSEYKIHAVSSGAAGIKAAERFLPDLILLDILMPGMDGYQVFETLKSSSTTAHIPVIFITGLDNKNNEIKGLQMGAVDYISKPFNDVIVKLRVRQQIQTINQTRLIIEKETAEKSSRARSEFLSRMSHEMRTPLNAIMGMTFLAKKTPDKDKRNEMLEKINSASSQLLKLIDDVLDLSDIEDNKLRLTDSDFSFSVLIRDILNKVELDIKKKHQSLTADIDPSIPDTLTGDEWRLAQVILNLLSNAIKFTPEQGVIRLNAFADSKEDETVTVRIEVIDNGIGISREQQEKLFVSFEQADSGVERKYGGAGLGLTISKHIVSLMGGRIWVESKPGSGSKFMFTFNMQVKAPEKKDHSPFSLAGRSLLLAEDMEINREIVLAMLEDTGLQITCAENGRIALEMFSSDPDKFDVILMDINMPEMGGVEVTRRIRAFGTPKSASIPIIAMTANVLTSEVETYLAAGVTDHIGKPVDFDKLLHTLYKYFRE